MLNDDIKVGDTLLYTRGGFDPDTLVRVGVEKVGRTLLHVNLGGWLGVCKFNRSDLVSALSEKHAYGRLFRSADECVAAGFAEIEVREADQAWQSFRRDLASFRPKHLTASQINEITSLIKGNGTDD